jgi:RimJ/RimL family protein N-acetyltransferase
MKTVHLVRLSPRLAPQLHWILQDPEVTRYLGLTLPALKDAKHFIDKMLEEEAKGLSCSRAILDERNRFIGFVSLFNINRFKRIGELGLFLDKSKWGKGYQLPAHGQMLEIAFRRLGLEVIVYFTHKHHGKARYVLEKMGVLEMNQGFRYPLVVMEKWASTGIWFDLHLLYRNRYTQALYSNTHSTQRHVM